jgi:hypothetical protein
VSVPNLLNKTCSVVRTTGAKAPTGATTYSESTTTGVPCAVQVVRADQRQFPREAGETEYHVYFKFGTDVQTGDKITTVTGLSNAHLSVQSYPVDDSGRGAYTRVVALHVQGELTT